MMRNHNNARFIAIFYLSILFLTVLVFSEDAYAKKAKAKAKAGFSDFDPQTFNGTKGNGTFKLGKNKIEIHKFKQEAEEEHRYIDVAGSDRMIDLDQTMFGTRAKAFSKMEVGRSQNPFDNNSYHPWTLDLLGFVDATAGVVSGKATAKGNDPAFFDPAALAVNPLFEETATLFAGSSIFEENSLEDEAFATLNRVSNLLVNPIFSIEIFGLGSSSVDAYVTFNSHPSLSFSTTPSALETLLEDPNLGLGTFDGSISDVSFNYTWDLSSFSVTSNDTIGGDVVGFAASSVPEPSTWLLTSTGLLSLLGYRWQRRKPAA